jgi:hypothetical protein
MKLPGGIMNGITLFLSFILATFLLTACSNDKDDDKGGKKGDIMPRLFAEKTFIKVLTEDGNPVAAAQVLIGSGPELLTTDLDGNLEVPPTWVNVLPVTISAQNFVRASYLAQRPGPHNYTLRKLEPAGRLELAGIATGFKVTNGDGKVDFAFVMPMLQKQDLLHFNIGMILSPESDAISVIGKQVEIPSNVSLPKQKESYIIGINLEKPRYRIYFNTPGKKKVYAARGQFPLKKVVDDLRAGKEFYQLINHFSIQGGGLREVDITGNQVMDFPINEVNYTQKRTVINQTVAANEVLLGGAVGDYQGALYMTDVKNLTPGGRDLLSINSTGNSQVLSVLKRKDEVEEGKGIDRISAVIMPFSEGMAPRHLPLMENPRVMSPYVVQVQKLQAPEGVTEIATYASLSGVNKTERAEVVTTLWEVYAPVWVDMIEIPAWPGEERPTGSLRWSVALIGGSSKEVDLGPAVMQAVTHVTNASADF